MKDPNTTFTLVLPCPASRSGWVEIADGFVQDDMSFIGRMTATDLITNPYVRPVSAAAAAERYRPDPDL